jgi:catechol 2,3-dioxygenase-like lactoylglutathione lyase family enzyme
MVITRRCVLERAAGLPVLVTLARAEGLFRATELNHVFVRARDPEKSRAFYERLFGPPKRRLTSGSVLFEFGSSEVGIGAIPNRPIGIDHFCISVEGFSMDTASAKLSSRRLTPERLYADDELYFRDPDGILVQLAAPRYRNPRALAIDPSPNPVRGLFAPLSLDHSALRVSNLERAIGFYETVWSLSASVGSSTGRDPDGIGTGRRMGNRRCEPDWNRPFLPRRCRLRPESCEQETTAEWHFLGTFVSARSGLYPRSRRCSCAIVRCRRRHSRPVWVD